MQRTRQSGLASLVVIAALALLPAVAAARAGESAHLKLGIVGDDDVSSSGRGRGVRVIELLGPRDLRGDLRRGDVVIRIDGRRVHDGDQLAEVLDELEGGGYTIEVLRRGEIRELRLPGERHAYTRGWSSDRRRWAGLDRLRERRWADLQGLRDLRRDIRREVRRDVIRDVRRNRHRDVIVLRDDRARIRDAMDRLRERLQDLESRLEDDGWR